MSEEKNKRPAGDAEDKFGGIGDRMTVKAPDSQIRRSKDSDKKIILIIAIAAAAALLLFLIFSGKLGGFGRNDAETTAEASGIVTLPDTAGETSGDGYEINAFDPSKVPEYSGSPYCKINGGIPFFTEADYTTEPFETYSPLDSLGRCGVAYANICRELMPTSKRGEIYMIKPSGWQHVEYDFVEGRSLYNRSHLIAHSLAGEDANERNLITGTRYMNYDGMNPFEIMVADYVRQTGNHVLYRVTPIFEGKDLVASGVLMEAFSVEDRGDGICFNIYCYNVQPGVEIDYSTGKSRLAESADGEEAHTYVLNTKTKKFHLPTCKNVDAITDSDKGEYKGSRDDLIGMGYVPCGGCNP